VQTFLHDKAIEYNKQHWAKSYLIDDDTDDFVVSDTVNKSKAKQFGLGKGQSVLLAQLGRDDRAEHLSLNAIFNEIKPYVEDAQRLVGGRILLLECEKNETLCSLYEGAGFVIIGQEKSRDGVAMYQMAITIKKFLKIPAHQQQAGSAIA